MLWGGFLFHSFQSLTYYFLTFFSHIFLEEQEKMNSASSNLPQLENAAQRGSAKNCSSNNGHLRLQKQMNARARTRNFTPESNMFTARQKKISSVLLRAISPIYILFNFKRMHH